jgi:hypothetical protein
MAAIAEATASGLAEIISAAPATLAVVDARQLACDLPDFAFLADIRPGWPVRLSGQLQGSGGTSGSTPFALSQVAPVSAREPLAGQPRVGFINPWIYQLYKQHPTFFYDVVSGGNDLREAGYRSATKAFFDDVTGLAVPGLPQIARHLPPPSPSHQRRPRTTAAPG